jgi:hypothetical protein
VSSVTLTPSPASPQTVGAKVTFTAAATGGSGSYEYQFVRRDPQGVWTTVRAYSSAATWTWGTTGAATGTYSIQVWARNAGSTGTYDTWAGRSFILNVVTSSP